MQTTSSFEIPPAIVDRGGLVRNCFYPVGVRKELFAGTQGIGDNGSQRSAGPWEVGMLQLAHRNLIIALVGVSHQLFGAADAADIVTASDDRVAGLVTLLGHDEYQVRERAHTELLSLGKDALPVLQNLGEPADFEARWRLRSVIKKFRRDPLIGTQWALEYTSKVNVRNKTIEFLQGGKFRVVKGVQSTPDDETWEPADQDGVIRFYFNNKYSTYEGRRVDNRTMIGKSHNIKGKTWTWRATMVDPPSK